MINIMKSSDFYSVICNIFRKIYNIGRYTVTEPRTTASILLLTIGFVAPTHGQTVTTTKNYVLETTPRQPYKNIVDLKGKAVELVNRNIRYIDGFGRVSQTVGWQASPLKKDLVQYLEYDTYGMESRKYLPYVHAQNNGGFKTGRDTSVNVFYTKTTGTDIDGIVRTPKPYSETVFENSPLHRIQQQGAPGNAWQPLSGSIVGSGHTTRIEYGTNVETGIELVKLWKVDYNASKIPKGATGTSKYLAGKLHKTIIKNENWVSGKAGTVDEYKDFEDRIILKRIWETESKILDTYYVYDDFGNLCYVIPPAVTATSFTESSSTFTGYIYAYRYDGLRRLVEKKIPGKGWEYLVYNANDQVVLTQDSLQRGQKKWTYNKYDAFGRVVEIGLYINNTIISRKIAQDSVNTHVIPSSTEKYYWEERVGVSNYSNRSFPSSSGKTVLVTNFYDDYTFKDNTSLGSVPTDLGITLTKVNGLLTASLVRNDVGSSPLLTINYYDEHGRVVRIASQNQMGGTDIVTNSYLFSGELKTSKREHKASASGAVTTILTTNEYDHAGRLVETKKKLNQLTEISQSKHLYNEIGQLKQKNLHNSGVTTAQEIVYGYNEQGWLKSLNNPTAVTAKRIFGMELSYGDKADAFNGNIGSMKWNTHVPSGMTMQPVQTYTYYYDKLNRLKRGTYINAATSSPANKAGFYDEELAYDVMGNIDTLRRRNGTGAGWYNHFKYSYSGNQLTGVADAGTAARANTFTYDGNGNGISNNRLSISKIEYNSLNLPVKLTKGTETLLYTYDANGKKLTKTLGSAKTQYVDGIQYKDGTLQFILTEEGRILPNGSSYIYEYFLKDHLGNTRAVVDQSGAIKQIQDYYPFGMEMNQGNALNNSNLYKYNGKEKQAEFGLDQLDYGARFYDAEIGRWNVVDPMAEMFFSYAPYSYSFNNPTNFEDFDGAVPEQGGNTDPIKLYGKRVNMDNAPAGSRVNAAGHARNGPWFWRQMLEKYPEMFNEENKMNIKAGISPKVNDQWIKYNPTHSEYKHSKLIHHHVDQGNVATGIPEAAHVKYNKELHPNRGVRLKGRLNIAGNLFSAATMMFDIFSSDPHALGMQFTAGNEMNTLYFDHNSNQYFEVTGRSDLKDGKGKVIGQKATYTTYEDYQKNKSTGKYEGVNRINTYEVIQYNGEAARHYLQQML